MEFRQLEVFAAVAEHKSFSKAAETLYLTQSTISSHIKNLEKELGKNLITRTTKRLSLTEEGFRFLPYVLRILETRNAALEELNGVSEQLLYLGASTIPSSYLLPQILSSFRQSNSNIYFSIKQGDSSEIHEKILDGSIEVGFVGSQIQSSQCVNLPFCQDELVLVTPSNDYYVSLHRKNINIETLLTEPMILREHGSGTQKAADRYLESINMPRECLKIVAEVNDLESLKNMIIGGMGISICSHFAVRDLEKRGLVIVYQLESEIRRDFYITYLKSRNLKPVLQAFLQYAVNYIYE